VKRLVPACLVVLALSSCAVGIRQPAAAITGSGATLNGKVLSTTGGPGSWYIEYGTTTARTQRTPTRPIDFVASESKPVSEPVDGLAEGTTYHFAVCAEDGENPGEPFCSPDQTFTTRAAATLDCRPGTQTFQSVDGNGDTKSVTCTASDDSLTTGTVTISGTGASHYSASSDCDNITLAPATSCTMTVTFSATDFSVHLADLALPHNGANGETHVQLIGINSPP
jgi:hypothetical protein